MHPVEKYIEDVLEGRIVTGRLARLAVERHVRDLENGADRGLHFSKPKALYRLDFYKYCRHFEGRWAGAVFEPSPWQQFQKWCIYGWMRDNGFRRFHEAYLSVARKNGKTTDIATDGLFLTGFDHEEGAQVFAAATKRAQAKIVHGAAGKMVLKSPELKALFHMLTNNIFVPETYSTFIPLGKDNETDDGLNPHGALIDEYHAHPSAAIYEVLESAFGSRNQPLIITITTRGFNIDCACRELEEIVIAILEGREENDAIFGMIHTIDDEGKDGDDWRDEAVWPKANPNLGVSIDMDTLREHLKKALITPSNEINFRTKRCNVWTEAKSIWFTTTAWNACDTPVDEQALKGMTAYGGLDLSTTIDMTAWVIALEAFGKINLLPRFFVPEDNVGDIEEKCKIPLRKWIDQGYVYATPGNVVDYDFVEAKIIEDCQYFKIVEYGFDPWNATQVITRVAATGAEPVEIRQGYKTMNPICKAFEKHVLAKEIAHGGNPVLAWMCRCTEVATDPAQNIKPVKPSRRKSSKRIDGMIASLMATSRADVGKAPKKSVYETRGLRQL